MIRPVWATRTGTALDPGFLAYSQTTAEDLPFVAHDLAASVAHVVGLHKAGLLDDADAAALVAGLQRLAKDHHDGAWTLDPALEDVHMNIEAALGSRSGDVAKRLHTGRSRNDQVATCITLYARDGLAALAAAAEQTAAALAAQAEVHRATPWVARTHGRPAQPATLGFLLMAHALRFQGVAKRALHAFHAVAESPLGCGAVAGSTLPLDPARTARLLGLQPPTNALLATGTRDTVVVTVHSAVEAGLAAAGLAQDLLDLFEAGHVTLPAGFTTGSSLMPQKRNPDALELARGKGRALVGPYNQVVAVVSGLGLGYQRDLQTTKPPLVHAVRDSVGTLQLLAACVQGATFDVPGLAASLATPGITATDAAEALVQEGMPFRAAYEHLAHYHALLEEGHDATAALDALGLDAAQTQAVQEALRPDPARRATRAGPAPAAVAEALRTFHSRQATLHVMTTSAATEAAVPQALLTTPVEELLA